KFVDPTGHDSMDLNWKGQFTLQHGYGPSEQDWQDRQFSLAHSGSGPNGAWTDRDWNAYTTVRNTIGPALLAEIGHPERTSALHDIVASMWIKANNPVISGPDGTSIALGGFVPPGEAAWTFGN